MTRLAERSRLPERMDREPLTDADAREILEALERINRMLGGWRATLIHLRRFSRQWKPGQRVRFVDWGTGGADLPRAIVRWARRRGFRFEVVGVDNNSPVLRYARHACRDYPEIRLVHADIDHGLPDRFTCDYALSSLCLHHLDEPQIVGMLRRSDRMAERGMIMNDLRRSARARAWIWALTRLARVHPMVQHDAPLSVERSFTSEDLNRLALQAGLRYLRVFPHFAYRLVLAGEKN